MAKRRFTPLAVALVCGLLLASLPRALLAEDAPAADGFAIPRSVIGGGGRQATDDGYILNGTVGEPIASNLSIGPTYGLSSGFWWPLKYWVYLPLVLKN